MGVDFSFNPWSLLRSVHSEVEVSCRYRLPDHLMGLQHGRRIWLCRTLTQAERRCTLTHELVHRERGPVPRDPVAAAAEERAVDRIAARRLITLPSLIDGLRWTRDAAQLAEHLWVDVPTLRARIDGLSVAEVADMEDTLNGESLWIP